MKRILLSLLSRQTSARLQAHRPPPLSYKYHRLGKAKDIRILRIEPGARPAEVRCTLQRVPFCDSPKCEALSYTWGYGSRTAHILCDELKLPVTENLLQALHHLRHKDALSMFWVDQICVSQEDLQERSQQVRLMGSIFHQAERVVIWLGNAT